MGGYWAQFYGVINQGMWSQRTHHMHRVFMSFDFIWYMPKLIQHCYQYFRLPYVCKQVNLCTYKTAHKAICIIRTSLHMHHKYVSMPWKKQGGTVWWQHVSFHPIAMPASQQGSWLMSDMHHRLDTHASVCTIACTQHNNGYLACWAALMSSPGGGR